MATYRIAASINGKYERQEFASIAEAAMVADNWRAMGSTPVRFVKDDVPITDADELDRLIEEEANAGRT